MSAEVAVSGIVALHFSLFLLPSLAGYLSFSLFLLPSLAGYLSCVSLGVGSFFGPREGIVHLGASCDRVIYVDPNFRHLGSAAPPRHDLHFN